VVVGPPGSTETLPVQPGSATVGAGGWQAIDPSARKADDGIRLITSLRRAAQRPDSGRPAVSDAWQNFLIDPDGARVELGFLRLCTRRWSARSRGREMR
jgi:hypothetical protein